MSDGNVKTLLENGIYNVIQSNTQTRARKKYNIKQIDYHCEFVCVCVCTVCVRFKRKQLNHDERSDA